MTKLFNQKSVSLKCYQFKSQEKISSIMTSDEGVSTLRFDDGKELTSSCINCEETYCIKLPISTGVFDDLYSSQKIKLCPTDAISPGDDGLIQINQLSCISCGMCVARCPVKAIESLDTGMVVNYDLSSIEKTNAPYSLSDAIYKAPERAYISESMELMESIIYEIENSKSPHITLNHLVNKAMQLCGIENVLSRQGDVNLRMDSIGKYKEHYVLCEIEKLSNLDSPRDILDDVAVFCSRYDINKENVLGMIVIPTMPNKRTEFWELLHDIYVVTKLRIAVVPLSALLLAVWNNKKIHLEDFFLNHNSMSARIAVEKMLGRTVNLPSPCNLLEPEK